MREVLDALRTALRAGSSVALATVVETSGPAPRPAGTAALVGADGSLTGNLTGGCVEAAVVQEAAQALSCGRPSLHRYAAGSGAPVGEAVLEPFCGGAVVVLVEPVGAEQLPYWDVVAQTLGRGDDVRLGTGLVRGDDRHEVVRRAAAIDGRVLAEWSSGQSAAGRLELPWWWVVRAPRRLLVFGSVDVASSVAVLGGFLGFAVTVCDARAAYLTRRRFPAAVDLVLDWPHRYLAGQVAAGLLGTEPVLLALTHEERFDIPLLALALRLDGLAYVGAMGSRSTHARRVERLLAQGLDPVRLTSLSSPLGLDLGASTPAETALSIMAEVQAVLAGGSAQSLADTEGPVHATTAAPLRLSGSRPEPARQRGG